MHMAWRLGRFQQNVNRLFEEPLSRTHTKPCKFIGCEAKDSHFHHLPADGLSHKVIAAVTTTIKSPGSLGRSSWIMHMKRWP